MKLDSSPFSFMMLVLTTKLLAYAGFYTLAAISLTLLSVSPFSQTRLSRRLDHESIILVII